MGQQYLDQTPERHKIVISNGEFTVQSALPDNFGFTVGSEFGTPFDTSSISQMLQKISIFQKVDAGKLLSKANVGQKLAFTMDKGFLNPQPTEISFEMEFNAYYSATDEVLVPMMRLLHMSLGSAINKDDADEAFKQLEALASRSRKAAEVIAKNTKAATDGDNSEEEKINLKDGVVGAFQGEPNTDDRVSDTGMYQSIIDGIGRALQFVKIMRGPSPCSIQFGNVYTFGETFISSVGIKFSNKLDATGVPLSGTASVTCILKSPPIAESLVDYFGEGRL